MDFIYRNDIFDAISNTLLEEEQNDGLNYMSLYNRCVKKLNKKISHSGFHHTLDGMTKEYLLNKNEINHSRVLYSLSEKAKKRYSLNILGNDERTEKRRNLYQLLILFPQFNKRELLTEKQLVRFLRQIGSSRKDLKEISTEAITLDGVFPARKINPIKGIEIECIQNNSKVDSQPMTSFYVVIPGFTVEEVISYFKKLRKGKDPRPFSSYHGITDIPFVANWLYTEQEVKDAIDSLRKDGLIRVIEDVFAGELRYDIVDDNPLKDFIKDVWLVHLYEFRILWEQLALDGKPEKENKAYLELLYHKKNANRFHALSYNMRKSHNEQDDSHEIEQDMAKDFVEHFRNNKRLLIQDLIKKHDTVINKYQIVCDLVEGICHSSFMPQG